jgi:hypothetical protein
MPNNSIAAFDDYLRQRDAEQVAPATVALEMAPGTPDQTANDLRLGQDYAKLTGSPAPPTGLVAAARPDFQRVIDRARNSTMLYGAPVLSQWVRDPDNAALAKDDLSNLSWWEGGLRAAGAGLARGGIRTTQQIPQQFLAEKAMQRAQDEGKSFADMYEDEQSKPGLLSPNNPLSMISSLYGATNRYIGSSIAQATGEDNRASAEYRLGQVGKVQQTIATYRYSQAGEAFKQQWEEAAKTVQGQDVWTQVAALGQRIVANPGGAAAFFSETAAESLPQMAAATAATALTRNPELGAAFMGGTSYATERYTSPAEYFQSKGYDITTPEGVAGVLRNPSIMEEAVKRGNTRGVIIGMLDGLSGGLASKELAHNPAADMLLQSVSQAVMGGGGEALAQMATDGKLDMSQVLAEALAEFVTAPVEVMGVGGKAFMNRRAKAERARAQAQFTAELSQNAQTSALRNRMPDKFQDFIAKAADGTQAENMLMPADKFVELFQSNGLDPYEAASELAGIPAGDIDRAIASGGDLRIPTAAYAAKIAGTELDQAFMENSRWTPDGMTLAEASEFEARMVEHMDNLARDMAADRAAEDAARPYEQEVYDTMVSRLRMAGRSTDVATTEAMLWPAFYRTIAERTGRTVKEMMDAYPLPDVQGAIPQGIQLREPDALAKTLDDARGALKRIKRGSGTPLLDFIRDRGGIDDSSGEVSFAGGKGKLIAKKPTAENAPGNVVQAAIEAGFLADDPVVQTYHQAAADGAQQPDLVPSLYAAIQRELAGKAERVAGAGPEKDLLRQADDIAEYLHSIGTSLDATNEEIRAAIEASQAGASYGQSEFDKGGRAAPVNVNSGTVLTPVELSNLPAIEDYAAARDAVELGDVTNASGDTVKVTKTAVRKWFFSGGNDTKRSLAPHFVDLFKNSVTYNVGSDFSQSAAHLVLDGKDVAVRFIMREIGGEGRKLYQVEGIELSPLTGPSELSSVQQGGDEVPISKPSLREEGQNLDGAGASAGREVTIDQAVAAFNNFPAGQRSLFQADGSGPVGARGSIQFPAGGVASGESIIRLFEEADLSTLLHESGHYFLTVMQDMAVKGDKPMAAEMDNVRAWWRDNAAAVARDAGQGVTKADVLKAMDEGTTGSAAKDAAIDVGMQEQWARAFESYLMEGKAPAKELRSAFGKFRAWLLGIYRRLRQLNSNVSDEIRGVFDRILATDDQINNARSETGEDLPSFSTAEQLGLTPEQFEALQERRRAAQDDAQRRALKETMEPLRREREKWFKDEQAKVAAEVERDVNTYPYYRAFEWMANGRWLGEDARPSDLPALKLNRAALIDRYGDGILKSLPRGKERVYAVDGIDPDDAAGWFGYDSGDALVRALEQAPNRKEAIKAETQRRVYEKYGDPLKDGDIENIALEAVHGERKGEWLAAELKAVVDVAGAGKAMSFADARDMAKRMLSNANLRDAAAANRYLAAERKAASLASDHAKALAADSAWLEMANRKIRQSAKAGSVEGVNAAISERNRLIETQTRTLQVPERQKTYQTNQGQVTRITPAHTRAQVSLGVNDRAKALIDAKNKQLLNHALFIEAKHIQEEIGKGERLVTRLGKASTRERIAEAGRRDSLGLPSSVDYLAAIDELLERYDFRRSSAQDDSRRQSLLAYVAAMTAAGRENELSIPEEVLKNAQRTPYKTLTTDEFRGVIASLQNLEHSAKRWAKYIEGQEEASMQETIDGLRDAAAQSQTPRPPGRVETKGERVRRAVTGYLDLAMNASSLLREWDGTEDGKFKTGGIWERTFKRPIDDAQVRLIARKEQAADRMHEIYNVYSAKERRNMNTRELIPELGISLSKWERISVALNMGNEGNLQRLMAKDDRGAPVPGAFSASQVQAIIATLDERDADFVQSVWDFIASYQPELAARERRVTGTEPEWVQAKPVTIGGKELKGGYYPIKYDPRLAGLQADYDIKELADGIVGGRFGKAQTKNGHLKARETSTNMPLKISMDVFHQHINQVLYDLEMSEPVSRAWQIMQNDQVRSLFREYGKQADYDALQIWLKDAAEGEIRSASTYGQVFRFFKSSFTMAKLGFNLGSALVQFSGLTQTFVVAGKKNAVLGIRDAFRPGMAQAIPQKSAFMRSRQTSFNKDISDFRIDPLSSAGQTRWAEIKNKVITPLAFWTMTKAQYWTVDVPTWLAGYRQGLEKFKGNEAEAIRHADDVVKRVGGSGIFTDRTGIERGAYSLTSRQNDFVRLFTALASYVFAKYNLAYERTRGGIAEIREGETMSQRFGAALSLTVDMALIFTAEAVITAAIRGQLPGDDEDKPEKDRQSWAKFLARETAFSALGTLPFVRDVVPALQGYGGGSTYGSIVETIGKPIALTFAGKTDNKNYLKSIVDATGAASGLPSTQINRVLDVILAEQRGQDITAFEALSHQFGRKLPR